MDRYKKDSINSDINENRRQVWLSVYQWYFHDEGHEQAVTKADMALSAFDQRFPLLVEQNK